MFSIENYYTKFKSSVEIQVNDYSDREGVNSFSVGFGIYNINDFSIIHKVIFDDIAIRM